MSTEKRIRLEAKNLLSSGNMSKSIGVFFILFAGVLSILFLQSFLVIGVEIAFKPFINIFSSFFGAYSFDGEAYLSDTLIASIQNFYAYLSYAVGFIFLFPLYCGVKRFFYFTAKGKQPGVNEVFFYLTKEYKKCLLLGFRYGLLCILKLIPCMLPTYGIVISLMSGDYTTLVFSLLTVLAVILGIVGLGLWVLWTSKQFLTIYLFIENSNEKAGFYVNESKRILGDTHYKAVRKLKYSFWGWLLLGLTGLGLIYFVPYLETSLSCSAKWLIKLDKDVC